MLLKSKNLEPLEIYKILSQTVIPRPIAWIVTEDEGVINIAPFSFFTPLSSNPPTMLVSIGYKDKEKTIEKDTLHNIKNRGKCTICVVDEHNLEKMHFSSKSLDKNQSEAEYFNIKTKTIDKDYPPMIADASVAYNCTFNQVIDLGEKSTVPVIVNIENIFIDDSKIDKKREKIVLNPVARLGGEYVYLTKKIPAPLIP
jgi:flavin reductase (DIM6/NTAB) family NADH-FMN oxidoreductase RutF